MESTKYDTYQNDLPASPDRPDFLKIICILSFVACGLWILICSLGTIILSLSDAQIETAWKDVAESNPTLAEVDPITFMHSVGLYCVYLLIANVFSLIGVIMMWRLEKIGFIIYAIAELSTHFFRLDMGLNAEQKNTYAGLILGVTIDLAFIAMYFANIKYMNKKNNNTYSQSGS